MEGWPLLLQIVCQDCGEDMLLVADDEVEKRIAKGEYVRGDKLIKSTSWNHQTEEKIFGICAECRRKAALADNYSYGSSVAVDLQRKRIQAHLALIRERRSDLTLEEAARAAVESEFDPRNEPNPAFRAYLLELAEKDEASDAAARGFLADLDGAKVDGAV
jgi:ssDNA-binding Zn-finger/Zn-ribbon topoisomerase 1